MKNVRRKSGQSTLEYVLIISVVVAALLFMQAYMKRSVMGKMKSSADEIGTQWSGGHTSTSHNSSSSMNSTEKVKGGDQPLTTSTSNSTQSTNTNEDIDEYGDEEFRK